MGWEHKAGEEATFGQVKEYEKGVLDLLGSEGWLVVR